MELMLTSFGVAEEDLEPSGNLFYRMPPVSLHARSSSVFMPDYAALLLCERVVVDESSFVSLEENPHRSFTLVADAIKQLYNEGFIKLVDFSHILKRNENLLQKMLEHDLKILDHWLEPLRVSLDIWKHFIDKSYELICDEYESTYCEKVLREFDHMAEVYNWMYFPHNLSGYSYPVEEALESYMKWKRSEYREALRQVLRPYLSHVNATIVLSNEIGVGFHDWADFLPFYRLKFLSVGKEDIEEGRRIEESQKLFEVSFPEFAIDDTSILINALHDERVIDLREMVEKAVKGEVTFDQEFARSVLSEVFGIERRTMRYRKIISYVTIPIGFVPWVGTPAQKIIEEAVGTPLERKFKQKYS